MATRKQITAGILILLVFTTLLYITLPEQVKIKVEAGKSSLYIWDNNSWLLTGIEYNFLYNGTRSIPRNSSVIRYSIDSLNITTIIRESNYSKGSIKDTYIFNGSEKDKEKFPVEHVIEINNAKGLVYQYEVRNLYFSSNYSAVYDLNNSYLFGKNTKIEWEENPYFSKITRLTRGKGKLILKFRIQDDYEIFHIRLFDPVTVVVTEANNTACSGSFSVSYPCANGYDNNWATEARALESGVQTVFIYENFTKPALEVLEANFTTKLYGATGSTTAYSACWNYNGSGFLTFVSWDQATSINSVNLSSTVPGCINFTGINDTFQLRTQVEYCSECVVTYSSYFESNVTWKTSSPFVVTITISGNYNNYEIGSNMTIKANVSEIYTICAKTGVLNFSCTTGTSFSYNWSTISFLEEFNDTTIIKNISFIGKQNQSIAFAFNETDVIQECRWNMTGFSANNSYPINVKILINDTLSNEFVSQFKLGTTMINVLNDSSTAKNISFNQFGTEYASIRMPKVLDIPNATMNFTGYNITTLYLNNRNMTESSFACGVDDCTFAHDQNWATAAEKADGSTTFYVNFSNSPSTVKAYVNFLYVVYRSAFGTSSLVLSYRNHNDKSWTSFYGSPGLPSEGSQAFNITKDLPYNGIYNTSNSTINLETIELRMAIAGVPGGSGATGNYYETSIGYYRNYSYNPYIEVGTVDNLLEFNYTGDFNYTVGNTSNINSSFRTYLDSCTADADGYCDVPIKMVVQNPYEPRTPMIQINNINITYQFQPNPITLNVSQINNYLNLTSSTSNVTFNIQSDTNGTLQINDIYCSYLGNKNISINITVYNGTSLANSTIIPASLWYSGFNYTMATQYLEFIPSSPTSKQVQPWGQNGSVPILNFTNKANGQNSNLSVYLNETNACVDLFFSLTNSSIKINLTQNTWTNVTTNWAYLNTKAIWLWANYSCSYSNWSLWNPYLSLRNCCYNCFCDTSGV